MPLLNALADYVRDAEICDDAVMALQSVGSDIAHKLLSNALSGEQCPCAAQIMVALADSQYGEAVQSYLKWYEKGNSAEQTAALYALAGHRRSVR